MENPGIITQNNKHNTVSGHSVLRYRKQVVMMLGTVVLSFFICLLPFRALTLWIIIVPPETVMSLGVEGYYILLYFCRIMLYLNSAVNPILYNLMSTKFRDGFLKLLHLNKFKRLQRFHKGDNIHRKDTFNTTTSTNYSSSQQTTDSFWRRYSSSKHNCQKSPQKLSQVKRKNSHNEECSRRSSCKVSEIIGVQNNRRNSMRFISDVILIPKEDKVNNSARNAALENYLEKSYNEVESCEESSCVENDKKRTEEEDVYSKDAIVIEHLADKATQFVRVPLIISKTNTLGKTTVTHFGKESFV